MRNKTFCIVSQRCSENWPHHVLKFLLTKSRWISILCWGFYGHSDQWVYSCLRVATHVSFDMVNIMSLFVSITCSHLVHTQQFYVLCFSLPKGLSLDCSTLSGFTWMATSFRRWTRPFCLPWEKRSTAWNCTGTLGIALAWYCPSDSGCQTGIFKQTIYLP